MPMRNDPRIRQTLNQISQNIETANTTTQTALFSFTEHYVKPCLASLSTCADQCTVPCCPDRYDERLRRRAGARRRGRAEFSFDFYDDWDDDAAATDGGGLLGWGNDELDRLLAGSGSASRSGAVADQPERKRGMSYGTVNRPNRRRTALQNRDAEDPTIVPSSSAFGFLERLPWRFGAKTLKYKPSAADLQENLGQSRLGIDESEPLIEESDEEVGSTTRRKAGRARSGTAGSGSTTESFRSRGDLFPSEDEDDAVPLDDEFAMALERRTTNSGREDNSLVGASGKRPTRSRTASSKSASMKSRKSDEVKRMTVARTEEVDADEDDQGLFKVPSLNDLKDEEERLMLSEEQDLDRRREAAQRLAQERGLAADIEATSTTQVDDPHQIDPMIPSQFPDTIPFDSPEK
ncbi:MAG: hypothetical protein M1814_004555 [Vezdaea aestivalis]|nr:MAG: hypothetical protein M1814_004555 [Vezdaea aestivalis]